MKPAPFAYHRPDTVAEACDTLAYYGEDGKILAALSSDIDKLSPDQHVHKSLEIVSAAK